MPFPVRRRQPPPKRGRTECVQVVADFYKTEIGRRVKHAIRNPERMNSNARKFDAFLEHMRRRLGKIGTILESDDIDPRLRRLTLTKFDSNIKEIEFDEYYDAALLRANSLDLLQYFMASDIHKNERAFLLFFDPVMKAVDASKLLHLIKEIMPGSRIVQGPLRGDAGAANQEAERIGQVIRQAVEAAEGEDDQEEDDEEDSQDDLLADEGGEEEEDFEDEGEDEDEDEDEDEEPVVERLLRKVRVLNESYPVSRSMMLGTQRINAVNMMFRQDDDFDSRPDAKPWVFLCTPDSVILSNPGVIADDGVPGQPDVNRFEFQRDPKTDLLDAEGQPLVPEDEESELEGDFSGLDDQSSEEDPLGGVDAVMSPLNANEFDMPAEEEEEEDFGDEPGMLTGEEEPEPPLDDEEPEPALDDEEPDDGSDEAIRGALDQINQGAKGPTDELDFDEDEDEDEEDDDDEDDDKNVGRRVLNDARIYR